jgi:hypothetical protein
VKRLALATALALACAAAAPARAEGWVPDSHRARAGTSIGIWSNSGRVFPGAVVPIVHFGTLRLPFEQENAAQLELEIPTAVWADGPDEDSRAGAGNPTFTLRWAPLLGPIAFSMAGRLGAPVGAIDDVESQTSALAAVQATARRDLWLWVPELLPWGLSIGMDTQASPGAAFFWEVDIGSYAPLDERQQFGDPEDIGDIDLDRRQVEVYVQDRLGMELRHDGTGFGGGFALEVVFLVTGYPFDTRDEDEDPLQTSLDAWLGYTHEAFFARAGNLLALDEPGGPPFDEGGVYTVYVELGAFLDAGQRHVVGRGAPMRGVF